MPIPSRPWTIAMLLSWLAVLAVPAARADATLPSLTPDEKAWIAAHPVIRLASDPVWAPVDFLDAQGQHQGMTADYVALLNAKLGLNMQWQQASMPWAEVLMAARAKRIDVVPTAGKRPEREEFLIFTEPPYVAFRSVIVVRDDAPFVSGMGDLAGKPVALVPGYAETADFTSRYPKHRAVPAATVEEALTDVATGRATATVGNLAVVNWVIRTKALTNLRIAALYTEEERSVHFAVRKDWPELAGILDKGLAAITADEHARIRSRWYEVEAQKGLDPKAVGLIAAALLLLVLAIGALVALWLKRLRHEVAERTRSEARAEAAEQRLREMTDSVPGAIFQRRLEPDGSVHYPFLSAGYHRLGELQTARSGYATQREEFEAFPPEERAAIEAARQRSIETLEPYTIENRMMLSDGGHVWVRTSAVPQREASGAIVWNGYSFDITDRKDAEAKIQAAERLLSEVTGNAPGFFFQLCFDEVGNGHYSFISQGVTTLTGYTPEELVADPDLLLSVTDAEGRARLRAAWGSSRERLTPYRVEYRIKTRAGAMRWLRGSATPSRAASGEMTWNGFTIDVTDEKALEAELADAKQVAEAANRAKSEFLANMSHEIRTPMNAIVGLSHLGLKTTAPARLQDYLRKIHGAAQTLLEIINSILDYSKIEAGMLSLEQTPFGVHDVLENLSGLLTVRAGEKGLELLFAVAPEVPQGLVGDPLRLGQVLLNLAGNALKFTERGQIVIGVAVESRSEARIRLRFTVADSGIGMNEAQLSRLFTAFAQADSSTTRQYGGTGLGLSISKRLVELMGGEIGATSSPGQGSTFFFTAEFGLSALVAAPLAAPADLRSLRVLAVDDNSTAVDILKSYLDAFGLRVDRASSGAEALAAVQREAAGDPYQLVLMDWQMPGMNGIEAAQQIRAALPAAAPKIVMVSAYGREELMRQAEDAGLAGFLIKPVNPSVLFDTILHAFGKEAALVVSKEETTDELAGLRPGLKVLVVEDHEVNQEVARDLLESFGCTVTLAADGKLGVDAAAAADFDIVLMDLQMPRMDGFEAARIIRAFDSPRAAVPIIAMTANAMSDDRQRCLAAGMDDHIGKPVDHRQLLATLIRWTRSPAPAGVADVAPAPTATDSPDGEAHFDFASAQNRLGDNRPLLLKLMRRFLDGDDAMASLQAQLAAGDARSALIGAHTLKGVAGTLGATALEEAARVLEDTLEHGRDAAPLLPRLGALHAAARQRFEAELAKA